MGNCCYSDEYDDYFGGREATRKARRFRTKGLRGSASEAVAALTGVGVEDAEVLEVGGGLGHIQIALLDAGAAHATNIDLSAGWEDEAQALLRERGLTDRVDRRLGDFVDDADELPTADVVILHRVVCCYPDAPMMLTAAAAHSRRLVSVTVPVEAWWTRAFVWTGNALLRLRKRQFRAFVHDRATIDGTLAAHGFDLLDDRRTPVWRILTFGRTAPHSAPNS